VTLLREKNNGFDDTEQVSPAEGAGISGGSRPDALFFAGDLGQRIFQQPFS
jgi:hypothetical protein